MKSRVLLEGPIFSVEEREVIVPSGKPLRRMVVTHPGAAVILPVAEDGRLVLIRQWRVAVNREILEFPAGTLEVGESPLSCAEREIQEETGYRASEWKSLGELLPAPGFCSERQFGFLATGLAPSRGQLDEDEILSVVQLSRDEVDSAIRSGELCDGKSIAFFARARLLGLL